MAGFFRHTDKKERRSLMLTSNSKGDVLHFPTRCLPDPWECGRWFGAQVCGGAQRLSRSYLRSPLTSGGKEEEEEEDKKWTAFEKTEEALVEVANQRSGRVGSDRIGISTYDSRLTWGWKPTVESSMDFGNSSGKEKKKSLRISSRSAAGSIHWTRPQRARAAKKVAGQSFAWIGVYCSPCPWSYRAAPCRRVLLMTCGRWRWAGSHYRGVFLSYDGGIPLAWC